MTQKLYFYFLFFCVSFLVPCSSTYTYCRDLHVNATKGSDNNEGTLRYPLKTIQAAAEQAFPGDKIIVHSGIYREQISPIRGGTKKQPIIFQAAPGERVEIKGSEIIKNWKYVKYYIWQVKIPNTFFNGFNPYADTISGDWLERGSWSHTGEVYLNGTPLQEVPHLDSLFSRKNGMLHWFCRVEQDTTYIWANFAVQNPNKQQTEINVRRTIFYPNKPFTNYIHIKGFHMSQAATPWAAPTAEQLGLIGTHWSKGWVIENNTISHSKCVGISLGKYGDEWDNRSESVEGFIKTTERALQNNWNREHIGSHIVRGNHISYCGQAGIAGSLGAIFSILSNNEIHNIGLGQTFWGYEIAGIKLHAPVDVLISHNHIYRTEGGIWLDWMAQGTRITGNLLHDNQVQDLSLEVNHGPILVDNNLFLSPILAQIKLSQGVSFVHNLIAWRIWPTGNKDERKTPYLFPHHTKIAGFHDCPCGNVSYFNNIFLKVDMSPYNNCILPVNISGNLYLSEANPSIHDTDIQKDNISTDNAFKIVQEKDGWYLYVYVQEAWKRARRHICTKDLGKAEIPNQSFTAKGIPKRFDKDYTGNKREKEKSYPGPLEFKGSGLQKIKVF